VNLGFNERDVEFLDQIRYFRNGMLYYGTILDAEYAKKVFDFMGRVIEELKKEKTPRELGGKGKSAERGNEGPRPPRWSQRNVPIPRPMAIWRTWSPS
jgi:hypothetical protein